MQTHIMAGRWGVVILLGATFAVFIVAAYLGDRRTRRLLRTQIDNVRWALRTCSWQAARDPGAAYWHDAVHEAYSQLQRLRQELAQL